MLLLLPFIGLLATVVLRVDECIFAPRKRKSGPLRPRFANFDSEVDVMADPDGRVSDPHKHPRNRLR
jgi:hypothetical protein